MTKELTSIPFGPAGHFALADLRAWLNDLDAYWQASEHEGRGGDALRLAMSIVECSEASNDREAELVRRGIRLGLHMSAFDRRAWHRLVAQETLRSPAPTVTDEQIAQVVSEHPKRAEQAKRLGLSVRQLQRRLAKMPKA